MSIESAQEAILQAIAKSQKGNIFDMEKFAIEHQTKPVDIREYCRWLTTLGAIMFDYPKHGFFQVKNPDFKIPPEQIYE